MVAAFSAHRKRWSLGPVAERDLQTGFPSVCTRQTNNDRFWIKAGLEMVWIVCLCSANDAKQLQLKFDRFIYFGFFYSVPEVCRHLDILCVLAWA